MENSEKKRKLNDIETSCMSSRKASFLKKHMHIEKLIYLMKSLATNSTGGMIEAEKILNTLLDSFKIGNTLGFSALENEDILPLLHLQDQGPLTFNDGLKIQPSEHFLTTLKKLFRRWNMSLESGRRSLIDAYILEAVDYDVTEENYDVTKDKLAVYPEYHIQTVHVEDNLNLTGSIDYVTASREESSCSLLNGGSSSPYPPIFCSIEAKRDEAFGGGYGEALGQMLALYKKNGHPIRGCLTDGMRWVFMYINDKGYYQSQVYYHQHQKDLILGILRYWVKGEDPLSDFTRGY